MKRNGLFGTLLAAALGVSLAAQSQTTPQATPAADQTQGTQPDAARPITITGCLTPISGAEPGAFTLSNVTGGAADSPTSYTLIGGDRSVMGTYGNSRVEVTGSLAAPVGTGNAVGTTGRGATTAAAPPSSPASPAGTSATGAASASPSSPTIPSGAVGTTGAAGSAAGAGTGSGAGSGAATGGGTSGGAGTGVAGAGTGAAGSITTAPAGATPPPPNFTVTSIRQVPGRCGGI